MRAAKCITALVISAALILAFADVAQRGCANFQAWLAAAFAYQNLPSLLLALAALRFLYRPVYDLLAFACYRLGLEPRFEGVPNYNTPIALIPFELRIRMPKPALWRKLIFGYAPDLLFGVFIAYIWAALAIRCG